MKHIERFKQGDKVKVCVAYQDGQRTYRSGEFVKYLNPFFTRAEIAFKQDGEIMDASAYDIDLDTTQNLGKL